MSTMPEAPHTSYIGESWAAEGSKCYERRNPADLDDVMGPYYEASREDVDLAVRTAERSRGEWGAMPAPLRGDIVAKAAPIVRSRADAIAAQLTREEGKTLAEAKAEVLGGAATLEYVGAGGRWGSGGEMVESTRPTTLVYTRRRSLGVVGVITPWNFPFANPALKIASALVAGNAVIWKPAPWTPATALALTSCLIDAGLPPGILNTLLGDADAGEQLAEDERVRAISFTGSTEVGKKLAVQLARRGARAQLEMGGKNAIVVLEDADVGVAAKVTAEAAFLSAGQKCTAASRVIVVPEVRETFLEALIEETRSLHVGDPTEEVTDVGPVVHERQLEKHVSAVSTAIEEGAKVVQGGERLDGILGKGLYMAPTILDRVSPQAEAAQREIFGPVLAVIDADGYEAALSAANATNYGLSASIYTADLQRALDFAERCEVGVLKINEPPTGYDPHVPNGGLKDSGMGHKELGHRPFDFFTEEKAVYANYLGRPGS